MCRGHMSHTSCFCFHLLLQVACSPPPAPPFPHLLSCFAQNFCLQKQMFNLNFKP